MNSKESGGNMNPKMQVRYNSLDCAPVVCKDLPSSIIASTVLCIRLNFCPHMRDGHDFLATSALADAVIK